MFAGFKIDSFTGMNGYRTVGESDYQFTKNLVEDSIQKYMGVGGSLEGEKIEKDWFPLIEANVFLSHSHKNLNEALMLAGWLSTEMGLKVFIDSTVWGFADDLLKILDDNFCQHSTRKGSYDYEKRNYSTSHVHMMLSAALTKMIDKTECTFFLNTPDSIQISEVVNEKTNSPWIYHELIMTDLIRKKTIGEHREQLMLENMYFEKSMNNLQINYSVTTKHLEELNSYDLGMWKKSHASNITQYGNGLFSLDSLYKLKLKDVPDLISK